MHPFRVIRALSGVLAAALCLSAQAEDLVWTGCGISKQAYMSELSAAFTQKTKTKVLMTGGGAAKGIRSVSAGENQIGGTCRHQLWNRNEVRADEANSMLTQVAWDALVVIVNQSNAVTNISSANLKKIYLGEIKNWKELGGHDAPINLIDRESKESGVGHMFRVLLFKDPNVEFPALAGKSTKEKGTETVEELVEKDPNALAVDGVSAARKRNVKLLALDGIEPSKANIGSGKYSLFRPLYLVTDINAPSGQARQFVDFALSIEGQEIISNAGTVNLAEGNALNTLWATKTKDLQIKVQ